MFSMSSAPGTQGATPKLFDPKFVEAISLQKNEIYLNQRK